MTECVYLIKILVENLLKSALYAEINKSIVILYHKLRQIAIKIVVFIQLFSLIDITQKSNRILPFISLNIAVISLHLHRQLLVIGINQKIAIQWDFPITYEMARAYQKANGKYLRQNQWEDITLVMSLELGK